ncbi:hypothetical protein [Halobacterium sp. R2-5]|uniref:hypothetical protein n=1 Tax=Halobacterium sp. R2-5 TaxID=2715751 RepID=UPI00141DA1B0|nr:hypothetical protein [Halobacterium sp. R2-5]NIC01080.1 hypothetical protein [Halobacterium sp. R2-5]
MAQIDAANNSTAVNLTTERVLSLIQSGDADEHAANITTWVESNADGLDGEQAAEVYRWMLVRSADARGEVPAGALDAVTAQLSEERARSVAADVKESLPEAAASRLQSRLSAVGAEWSVAVSGWLNEQASTTAAPTTDSPPPTTAAASGGSGGDGSSGERIDDSLTLVSSSYDASTGTATVVLESDGATAVTLSDAGGFIDGGTINRRTFVAQDGRNTIEFDVTETDRGYVGVSIATEEVLYAEVIESPSLSPFRDSSGTVGWLAGAGIVLVSFIGAALWKLYQEGGEPVEASV